MQGSWKRCEKLVASRWLLVIALLCTAGLLWPLFDFLSCKQLLLTSWSVNSASKARTLDGGYTKWKVESRRDGQILSITEDNFASVIADASNDWGELIFTTFGLWGNASDYHPSTLDYTEGSPAFTFNWVSKLHKAGVKNWLAVGTSYEACAQVSRLGLSCFVDNMPWGKDIQRRSWVHGFYVRLKWYYLLRMVELGHHPMFMDNDALVLKSPFAHWDRSVDFQGLADATDGSGRGELPDRTDKLVCPLKDLLYDGLNFPCMSTGVMLCRSTPATKAVLASMVGYLEAHWDEWEQAAFQKVVLPFLIQMGDGPPALRLRLLPTDRWHNVGDLNARRANNLSIDSVVVHCGYIHGGKNKSEALRSVGLWEDLPPL